MRILFVSPYLPSLIRVRPFNYIRALAERGHNIVLVALTEGMEPGVESLKDWCERIETFPLRRISAYANSMRSMFGEGSLQAAYCRSPETGERVEEILRAERFDAIHVEHLRAAQFIPEQTPCPKVIDAVDCITSLYDQFRRHLPMGPGRLKSQLEWKRLRRYEPRLLNRFDDVLVTCERERQAMREIGVRVPIAVVGNGVDFDYFDDEGDRELFTEPTVVFSGKMSYAANADAAIHFATDVFPRVREQVPDARFLVVGSYPGRKVRALDRLPGVEVTGAVDDLRQHIRRSHVAVSPMRIAVGVQNKILEAMALGVPVVASSRAIDGIEARPGQAILAATTAGELADAVGRVLTDPGLAASLSREGRAYVHAKHNWKDKARDLESVYEHRVRQRPRAKGSLTDAA